MHFDVATLLIVQVGLCSMLGTSMLRRWWLSTGSTYLLIFGATFLLAAASYTLIALRGKVPDWLSILIANALLLAAVGICWNGFRVFNHRRPRWAVVFVAPLLWSIACGNPVFYGSIALRVAGVWSVYGLFFFAMAYEVWIRGTDHVWARRLIGAVCFLGAILSVARAGVAFASRDEGWIGLLDPWSAVAMLVSIFAIFSITLLALGMTQQRTEGALRRQAAIDGLTGLLNRGAFVTEASARIAAAARAKDEIVLLLFDLDRFKEINDSHGHAAGDAVLAEFADILRKAVRETDAIGRIGGEEFAALLTGVDSQLGNVIAESIRRELVRRQIEHEGVRIRATVSVGMAIAAAWETDLAHLMARSDSALYAAKRGGRDLVIQAAG